MRIQSIYISIGLALVALLCGCSTYKNSIEAKRQFAINRQQHVFIHSKSPIFRQWGTNILSMLSSADTDTLKHPHFASATIGRDRDNEYRLYVFWLENKPSIDGVELRLSKTNSVMLDVPASDAKENEKTSKVSVVMVASWIWSGTNNIADKLDKVNDVSDIKVRLLKNGSPKTDWCAVSFYRLDHWMGSKEITEVTTGPSVGSKTPN